MNQSISQFLNQLLQGPSRWAERFFSSDPEWLIRLGRLILAGFALIAVSIDPTRPDRNTGETFAVLLAYLIYSAVLCIFPSRLPLSHRSHVLTHLGDIVSLSILAFLTGELSSPFFAFFTFALITAAMRWGVSGALLTALVLDLIMVAVGWPYVDPGKSDLNILIMRSVYALVAAVMLGYFASYRERSRRRLMHLAAWPPGAAASEGGEPWLASSLGHASEVLGGARLMVHWGATDASGYRAACWDGKTCVFFDQPAEDHEPIRQSKGFGYGYALDDGGIPPAMVRWLRDANPDLFLSDTTRPAYCRADFVSPSYRGTVYVIDPGHPNDDIRALSEIVAARIASELERSALVRELATTAGWRERSRLARDLHDSVLQDLTAAMLQLKSAARQSPERMGAIIELVDGLLAAQQKQIRRFVENARQAAEPLRHPLGEQLQIFAQTLGRQWHCAVDIAIEPSDLSVTSTLCAEICQLVSEATANAVRHGKAGHVDVSIGRVGDGLVLAIKDDGVGMGSNGAVQASGPKSIRGRVSDLGGSLAVPPSEGGLQLLIRLPA